MILVTGATGNLGSATIDFLIKKGYPASQIAALVRNEAKATDLKSKGVTLKAGTYDDYASLVQAFKGVEKLLLVSSTEVSARVAQHNNVINAAKEAGVKHLFYTGFERKNDTDTSPLASLSKSHIDTENAIKASGLTYTIFNNNLYLDVLPMFFGDQVLTKGIIFPAGDTKSAFASRNDMAEAIANVLMGNGHENKEYALSNTENVSMQDLARDLTDITGKTVNYTSPPTDEYVNTLKQAGVPAENAAMSAGFAEAIKQGEFTAEKTDLENILGRKPQTAKQYLTEVYAS